MYTAFWIAQYIGFDLSQIPRIFGQNAQLIVAIVALSAFVVAVVNLWYSSLTGPIITLVDKPNFTARSLYNNATDSPYSSEINLSLPFVNSGSRTGVFKLIFEFTKLPTIADCIDRYTFKFESDDNDPVEIRRETTLLFVRERDSKIINVTLNIEFYDWKSHFEHDPVEEQEVCNILRGADDTNKELLDNFCQHLREIRSLGVLSVDLVQTQSRLVRRMKDKTVKRNLFKKESIGIDNEFSRSYQSFLTEWESVMPNKFIEFVEQAESRFNSHFHDQNYQKILNGINNDDERIWWESYFEPEGRLVNGLDLPTKKIMDFILQSFELKPLLLQFSTEAKQLNLERSAWKRSGKPNYIKKSIDPKRELLKNEYEQIWEKVRKIKLMFHNCIVAASVVPATI